MIVKQRHEKTIKDLERLQDLCDQSRALYKESQEIKNSCPCYDLEPKIVETLAYEYTPRGVCVVCGSEKNNLTVEQKFACLKDYLVDEEDDAEDVIYSDAEILSMAQKGGYNTPDPGFYLRNKDAPNQEN